MKIKIIFIVFAVVVTANFSAYSQVILEADGPGDTYELINSVLAPGYNVVENPECVHSEFGRHVTEVWDSVLNQYVFEFYIHVTPDNDRCINFDRQRMEIKTYDQSPDSLIGVVGETVTYKWKFKIPSGFQPSGNFTHIHQIKPVGGDDGNPLYALTVRKGTPDRLELKFNNTTVVKTVGLSLIEDVWVECTETMYIAPVNGTYSMTIKRVSDGTTLLSYNNNNIMTIRPDNSFIRPKWGIYRSLLSPSDLRDEAVRFAGFFILEGSVLGITELNQPRTFELYQNYPNPFNPSTTISYSIPEAGLVKISIYNTLGELIKELINENQVPGNYSLTWDAEKLNSGVYLFKIEANNFIAAKKMLLIK